MHTIEVLINELWLECLGQKVAAPFQKMTYQEAMTSYGSDKPDLRLEMKVCAPSPWDDVVAK